MAVTVVDSVVDSVVDVVAVAVAVTVADVVAVAVTVASTSSAVARLIKDSTLIAGMHCELSVVSNCLAVRPITC